MNRYIVVRGDNLWRIAINHGVNYYDLLRVNPGITNPNLIYPGQIINIPINYQMPNMPQIPTYPQVPSTPNVPSNSSTPSTPVSNGNLSDMENEVLRLVNEERTKAKLPVLKTNNEISKVARIKSNDFINNNYFAHNSPTYGTPFDMLRSYGINFTAAAENIASGQGNAKEVMTSWMNSPGHRANILNKNYNQIGVGAVKDNNGKLYWTQMFIKK